MTGVTRSVLCRIIGVGLIAAAALMAASASHAQFETTDPDTVSGTLVRIKATGVVRIGHREASIPFSFLDRAGRPIGYSIDLCNAIMEEIGHTLDRDDLKAEFVKVKSDDRLEAVVENRIDLECGSASASRSRR
jgi:glutamate/aspartate transport system substrate-binding protein